MDFLPLNEVAYNRLVKIQYNVGLEIDILHREMKKYQESNDVNKLLFEILICDVRTQMMMLAFVQSIYKKKGNNNPLFDYEALEYLRTTDKTGYEKFEFVPHINVYFEKCNNAFNRYNQEITPILKILEEQFPDYNKMFADVMTAYIHEYPYGISMAMMNGMYFEGLDYDTERNLKRMYIDNPGSNTLKIVNEITDQFMEQYAIH